MNRFVWILAGVAALVAGAVHFRHSLPFGDVLTQRITQKHTVSRRLEQFGDAARARYAADFQKANCEAKSLLFVAFKAEKRLEIYARDAQNRWKWVKSYPIVRASGEIGPKLREGDGQVPEGVYEIESFNPNSAFHVSLRVSYPSREDREIAARENRENLGGDIMIHGGAASIGCLAMGDEVAEELFVLAADAGRENVKLVFCPLDFRRATLPENPNRAPWLTQRYAKLREFVAALPASNT